MSCWTSDLSDKWVVRHWVVGQVNFFHNYVGQVSCRTSDMFPNYRAYIQHLAWPAPINCRPWLRTYFSISSKPWDILILGKAAYLGELREFAPVAGNFYPPKKLL